ncbi:MAG TPA: hypothetical protein VFJ18_10370 [Pararhizobium sp.]|jgi:hypothetical protein|nr:hypothetical protein [Pararhizobium sp.]
MFNMKSVVLGAAVLAMAGAPAFAAGNSMTSKMAPSEVKTMHECQGMSHNAMMNDSNCTALMKKYPNISMGTTGSIKSNGSNAMKTKTPTPTPSKPMQNNQKTK